MVVHQKIISVGWHLIYTLRTGMACVFTFLNVPGLLFLYSDILIYICVGVQWLCEPSLIRKSWGVVSRNEYWLAHPSLLVESKGCRSHHEQVGRWLHQTFAHLSKKKLALAPCGALYLSMQCAPTGLHPSPCPCPCPCFMCIVFCILAFQYQVYVTTVCADSQNLCFLKIAHSV